jgi:O-antigen ligase
MKEEAARLGAVVGAVGLGVLLVAPSRRWRAAGLGGWAVGCALLALSVAPAGHHRLYAAGAVAGVIAAVVVGGLFVRWQWLLPVAVLACAPARIRVTLSSHTYNLLLPLYVIVAGAAVALAAELLVPAWTAGFRRGHVFESRGRHIGEVPELEVAPDREPPALGIFAWPAALLIGWSGLALLWSEDRHQGAIYLLFYMLPLGLIAAGIARLPWRLDWVKILYIELALMALAFAALGIYQYATRTIYWNPKVKVDNAYAPVGWFYRVNSVFYDPSIYGRFLVVAILASVVLVLFEKGRWAWIAALFAAETTIGLIFSFSQSSFFALAVGVAVALVMLWRRVAILPLVLAGAVLAAVTLGVPQLRHRVLGKAGISHATGGRSSLVSNGLKVFEHHPVIGVGTGGFAEGYHRLTHRAGRASHTAPITVAAETGIVGLGFLAWLLYGGLTLPYRRNRGGTALERARLAFGLALLTVVVHSLFYNALIEDPVFWAALALTAVGWRQVQAAR